MKHVIIASAVVLCLNANAQQHDWENQYVLQKNRMPARAAFIPYLSQNGDMQMSLNGEWKFNWTKTPDEQPQDFFNTSDRKSVV